MATLIERCRCGSSLQLSGPEQYIQRPYTQRQVELWRKAHAACPQPARVAPLRIGQPLTPAQPRYGTTCLSDAVMQQAQELSGKLAPPAGHAYSFPNRTRPVEAWDDRGAHLYDEQDEHGRFKVKRASGEIVWLTPGQVRDQYPDNADRMGVFP